ncbi:hypothetical protein TWF102_006078 [Orbilia oligospora]|uniref:Uncharacterized protein n=1 Tax=Orbilia oligospora TaxID=2813651 RepID=A0A7C8NQX5_ORBOL|nr:hypothetical protein TWF102_006078 [Orbilia oligospora]KAF3098565.1 hypothetical protein TWF103_009001 [Orbilia oligospora]KAF3126979.1 hypothetical protein TWF703_010270 [Orbilia oligospora]KAF3144285.1 hypothetical protein TWF594_004817 [Orbilia oligospora]
MNRLQIFLVAQLLIAGTSPAPLRLDVSNSTLQITQALESTRSLIIPTTTVQVHSTKTELVDPVNETPGPEDKTSQRSTRPGATYCEPEKNPTSSSTSSSDIHELTATPHAAEQSAIDNNLASQSLAIPSGSEKNPSQVMHANVQYTQTVGEPNIDAPFESSRGDQVVATEPIANSSVALVPPDPRDKRYGNEIGPQFFYETAPVVKCPSAAVILSRAEDHRDKSWPQIGTGKYSIRPDFAKLIDADGYKKVHIALVIRISNCRLCSCDPSNPEAALQAGPGLRPRCSDIRAQRCATWFGCTCFARLIQPLPTDASGTHSPQEWQDAINSIPPMIVYHNPGWTWQGLGMGVGAPGRILPPEEPPLWGPDDLGPDHRTLEDDTGEFDYLFGLLHDSSSSGGFKGRGGGRGSGSGPSGGSKGGSKGGFSGFHDRGDDGAGAGVYKREASEE